MTATIDANILIYAADSASPHHERSVAFLGERLAAVDLVYLFWPVVMAYLRISTHPRIFRTPQSLADATANVDDLLARPNVRTIGERDRFWPALLEVAADGRASADLVSDAWVVALMRENGVRTIWTHDRGFRRFRGIEVRDPFDDGS